MTSLGIHSRCRGSLALDENPSGCFWDSGVVALDYSGGDHWSSDSAMERYAWADSGPEFTHFLASAMNEQSEGASL